MLMENVDGDHYFLSLITNESEFSFEVWIVGDIFNFIESLLRKRENLFCQSQWLSLIHI